MRRRLSWLATLVVTALAIAPPGASAQATCDATQTTPVFGGKVPTLRDVAGYQFGEREATVAEINRYLQAVDDASSRVVTGTAGRSVQGRALRYAVVGRADRMTPAALARIRGDARRLRDPGTSTATAEHILARQPSILWIAGNVHGGEESGADAALRTLYELADREDCAARQIRDGA